MNLFTCKYSVVISCFRNDLVRSDRFNLYGNSSTLPSDWLGWIYHYVSYTYPILSDLYCTGALYHLSLSVSLSRSVCVLSGLRTLCYAVTNISDESYGQWAELYQRAATSLTNRALKMEESYELIERVTNRRTRLYNKIKTHRRPTTVFFLF